MAVEPLKLAQLRREQRRVAALLNRNEVKIPLHHYQRKPIPNEFPLVNWCSKLDRHGHHRNPALDHLRQGLRHAKTLDLPDIHNIKSKIDAVCVKKSQKTRMPASPELDQSKDLGYGSNQFNIQDDGLSNQHKTSSNAINNRLDTASSHDSSPGVAKPLQSSNFDYYDFKKELTQSLDRSDTNQSLVLPTINEKVHFSNSTAQRASQHLANEQRNRRTKSPVRLPRVTRSHSADSDRESLKSYQRKKSFYSSVPTMSNSNSIDYDNFRAQLQLQHGLPYAVPPVREDKLREFLVSRQNTREGRFMTPLQVDRLDTRESSRWCQCGIRPMLGRSAKRCLECKHRGYHETWCNQFSEDSPPVCSNCGKLLRYASGASQDPSPRKTSRGNKSVKISEFEPETLDTLQNNEHTFIDSYVKKVSKKKTKKTGVEISEPMPVNDGHVQSPKSYLEVIEHKIQTGEYDYETEVNIDDVNTTLTLSEEVVVTESKDSDSDAESENSDCSIINYGNIHRMAYMRALADARAQTLPSEAWLLGNRISRAFVFSYFDHIPNDCNCAECGKKIRDKKGNESKPKKVSETKMLFGNINPDDYYPGGPKGPKLKRRRTNTKQPNLVLPTVVNGEDYYKNNERKTIKKKK